VQASNRLPTTGFLFLRERIDVNFYPFHIGDYLSQTAHLSDSEDIAYRRMIDLYYQSEKPFTDVAWVARRIRSTVEIVSPILAEFFQHHDGVWHNKRCDEELAKYHAMQDGGRKGAAMRWAKPSDSPPIPPLNTPQCQPRTKNQEPLTKNQVTTTPPDGVSLAIWQDFVSLRKAKRAAVTKTALQGIEREAQKAGLTLQAALQEMCARGWTGFKAEWLQKKGSYHESLTTTGSSIFGGVRHEREVAGCVDQENLPSHARPLRLKVVTDVDDGPGS
jgi:uncharacterized protein YdaU (DUF1376 family)